MLLRVRVPVPVGSQGKALSPYWASGETQCQDFAGPQTLAALWGVMVPKYRQDTVPNGVWERPAASQTTELNTSQSPRTPRRPSEYKRMGVPEGHCRPQGRLAKRRRRCQWAVGSGRQHICPT